MKRKRLSRVLIIVVALVLVFAFSSTALAALDEDSWSSTVCYYGFTTSNSIVKNYGEWFESEVHPEEVYWPGHPSWTRYLLFTFKSSTGVTMSIQGIARESLDDGVSFYESNNHLTPVKMRIDNPHQGYNMISNGTFAGYYS